MPFPTRRTVPSRREVIRGLGLLGVAGPLASSGLGQLVTGLSKVAPAAGRMKSDLELRSSDAQLVDTFQWARSQAMAYAFDDHDPVGPWYEAVEPGREGFCIRDTCHQALGAHLLGLARFNGNMLRRFAENVSDAKDWCSYWEIDRYGRPAPVDYKNDAEFWYNLPANFDLVDCCYRMYVWSGDRTYLEDPVFLNLYDRTVNDYVERWGLDLEQVMQRPRLLNARGILDAAKKFPKARGIPGYNESDHTYIVGLDVLETQRAAYLAYAHLQQARMQAELADKFLKKAAAVEELLKAKWWNAGQNCYYARLNREHQPEGCGVSRESAGASLTWRADVIASAAEFAAPRDVDAAYARLVDLSHARLEYPEVSFARVGDLVNRAMGVTLEYSSPLLAEVEGNWVEVTVRTLSGLGKGVAWAEVDHVPVRSCEVMVRHDGATKTRLVNRSGPALIWRAMFAGKHETLLANGTRVKATSETDGQGQTVSSARITVGAGGGVEVEAV